MEVKDRKERLRQAQSLLNSEGWSFLKEEIEREKISHLDFLITYQRNGENDKAKFVSGIIEGFNMILNRPQFIATRSLGILDKLGELMGVNR